MKRDRLGWGVIMYSGNQDDPAKFDGWYACKGLARDACTYWRGQYPEAIVALVERHGD
jgi:hypothetical protein